MESAICVRKSRAHRYKPGGRQSYALLDARAEQRAFGIQLPPGPHAATPAATVTPSAGSPNEPGKRDVALLTVMLGCGLEGRQVAALLCCRATRGKSRSAAVIVRPIFQMGRRRRSHSLELFERS
jgi:hypothetical protein